MKNILNFILKPLNWQNKKHFRWFSNR